MVADRVQDLTDAELQRSLDPCLAGAQLMTAAKKLRDVGVLQRLVDHMASEDRRTRESRARITQMRELAYLYLDELRIKLLEDPSVYGGISRRMKPSARGRSSSRAIGESVNRRGSHGVALAEGPGKPDRLWPTKILLAMAHSVHCSEPPRILGKALLEAGRAVRLRIL